MASDNTRERDLVLAPNEYAYISDQTKGNVNVYVGPYKTSLANTDQPVTFDQATKRFVRCVLDTAIQVFPTAPEGWYVVLKNPSKDKAHPKLGTVSSAPELEVGKKVNLTGPISFPLWPGQMARVVQGHRLRSNQYLLVRVYDEAAARENWKKAIMKPQPGTEGADATPPEVTLGMYQVIKGTDVSFFIPPTGVEVVRDEGDEYVREAVTLERLEYCILLDEDGNKRFIQGPAVVFPKPTENFIERVGTRKFRAIELNEISGIYVKVIAPYEENGKAHKVGDELFITGREQMIYFPRPEHAVIKYGEQEIHYAVAIPKGEGRYCLDRTTGQIRLVKGPAMFLPDPRTEVIVRRVLETRKVELWFPGNQEAVAYNQQLRAIQQQNRQGEYVLDAEMAKQNVAPAPAAARAVAKEAASDKFVGDELDRKGRFTPPRSITLDTKYDGAVNIGVWTGYAVLVSSKSGSRRVVVGPDSTLLDYDETLEAMELSTGTPKRDDRLHRTVYLRVAHNKVSDQVEAETRDLVQVQTRLSYRVNFEGEPAHWFDVENYVRFLTDHLRSVIRSAVKRVGVQDFYADPIRFLRDTILGAQEDGKRPGRKFEENGMRVYDVEVLDVRIGDETIQQMLVDAQHGVVTGKLAIEAEQRRLAGVRETLSVDRAVADEQWKTLQASLATKQLQAELQRKVAIAELDSQIATRQRQLASELEDQKVQGLITEAGLARRKAEAELEAALERAALAGRLEELKAEVDAVVRKAEAISPDLVAALQAFSDRALVERVSSAMAPLAILGGKSVQDVISGLLRGTSLERVLAPVATGKE